MTKFGTDQIDCIPPQWWRRLERALFIIVVPSATTFVTSIVESERMEVVALSTLTFLTAIIKGVGVFLGTDLPYPQEKENEL